MTTYSEVTVIKFLAVQNTVQKQLLLLAKNVLLLTTVCIGHLIIIHAQKYSTE